MDDHDWEKNAREHIDRIRKRFPERQNWVPTARYLERALAALDQEREAASDYAIEREFAEGR